MLILRRKIDEVIILELPNGDQIDIVITDINKSSIKVGIDATSEINIVREELLEVESF